MLVDGDGGPLRKTECVGNALGIDQVLGPDEGTHQPSLTELMIGNK